MMVIGITGGMASGKSTVARMIARPDIALLDADELVHWLMQDDPDMIAAIGARFPDAVGAQGIDRAVLSRHVVNDPAALAELEAIIHPLVREAEEDAIADAKSMGMRALLLDIPLLFETQAELLCDKVIAVSIDPATQKARAFSRPGMTEDKWQRLTARQLRDEDRAARADAVIRTGGTLDDTRHQVETLMHAWRLA